ncbi:GPP34 family phosphoprotein [Kribbella sp. NPDC051770]|uniref:GOLPH3/VPS74 family protein n=1 Tax=Kribbella sp. NPDC051770 TaxID=3155413 RepID=UPI00343DBD49
MNARLERQPKKVASGYKLPDGLPERLYLLALDPMTGKLSNRSRLGLMLRAAALTELQLDGKLSDQDDRVVAVGTQIPARSPLGEQVFAEVEAGGRKRWKYWVERHARTAVPAVRDELERTRLIRVEHYRRLLVFPAERITLRQPLVRRQLLQAATDTLRPARLVTRVDLRDAALVVLASAGELKPVLSKEQRKQYKDRIAQLTIRVGPVGPALRKAVQQQNAAANSAG